MPRRAGRVICRNAESIPSVESLVLRSSHQPHNRHEGSYDILRCHVAPKSVLVALTWSSDCGSHQFRKKTTHLPVHNGSALAAHNCAIEPAVTVQRVGKTRG